MTGLTSSSSMPFPSEYRRAVLGLRQIADGVILAVVPGSLFRRTSATSLLPRCLKVSRLPQRATGRTDRNLSGRESGNDRMNLMTNERTNDVSPEEYCGIVHDA
jgi:hypothetical protein